MLGEFEEKVLMAVLKNHENAYGTTLYQTLEAWERKANMGAIYTTLARLEAKGLVDTDEGAATRVRGGRRKKLYRVTGSGISAINEARNQRKKIEHSLDWHGLWGLV